MSKYADLQSDHLEVDLMQLHHPNLKLILFANQSIAKVKSFIQNSATRTRKLPARLTWLALLLCQDYQDISVQ